MLHLPDVTLVCPYTIAHRLHEMAAEECLRHAKFGDVLVGELSGDYVRYFHYEMPKLIRTSHILMIQWDSWIINPNAWTDEFLNYDYVGAPWWYRDEYNVGNSGFCLRSKQLLEFIAQHPDEFPIGRPEDHILCREYQKRLPQFKWAPQELAWHFSFERTAAYPLNEVFGFHGVFNFPIVLKGDALADRLALVRKEPYITSKPEWQELMQRLGYAEDRECSEGVIPAA